MPDFRFAKLGKNASMATYLSNMLKVLHLEQKYYWDYYFCVIYGTLKSCNFHQWQISLTKLSLLALMTFVRHRRQQISLTARYSLDIYSTPPFLNIMPAVASCVGTAVSTNSLPVYKTIKTKNAFYQLVLPLNYFNLTWAWRLYGVRIIWFSQSRISVKTQ